jgi:hypothetical protein
MTCVWSTQELRLSQVAQMSFCYRCDINE